MTDRVNTFMQDLQLKSPDTFELVDSIRKIFLSKNQLLDEDIKYGGLVFNVDKALIGGIFSYKNHISIEFSEGADFTDPSGFLEGKGKRRRHIKIVSQDDIKAKTVSLFVAQAV